MIEDEYEDYKMRMKERSHSFERRSISESSSSKKENNRSEGPIKTEKIESLSRQYQEALDTISSLQSRE